MFCMMEGKTFFKQLAKTFEKILYNTLHKLIGRNWWAYSGELILGISEIKVWLRDWGNVPEFSHMRMEKVTS